MFFVFFHVFFIENFHFVFSKKNVSFFQVYDDDVNLLDDDDDDVIGDDGHHPESMAIMESIDQSNQIEICIVITNGRVATIKCKQQQQQKTIEK